MTDHAQGGEIRPRTVDGITARLSDGVAVVSDEALATYGRAFFEELQPGGRTVILSASEALAAMDDA